MNFKALFAIIGVLFIALMARLTFPVPGLGIPISGQSFAVLLTAYILGRKWGTISIFLYLLLGCLGLPIFADGESGFQVLTGYSGGFLYGFLAGAWLTGGFSDQGWTSNFGKSLVAMTIGTAAILFLGFGQLAYMIGISAAFKSGILPYLPGAAIKIVLGAAILPIYHYFKSIKQK